MNLKTATVRDLSVRLHHLESAIRFTDARGPEAAVLADAWERARAELDSRPTQEVLAAL